MTAHNLFSRSAATRGSLLHAQYAGVKHSGNGKIVVIIYVQHRRIAIVVYSQLLERKVVVHDPVFSQGFLHRCRYERLQPPRRQAYFVGFRVLCKELGGGVLRR